MGKEKIAGIYKLTCKTTLKAYVGQTMDLDHRIRHGYELLHCTRQPKI